MGILDLFKKKDGSPPDVGKEDLIVEKDADAPEDIPEDTFDESDEEIQQPSKRSGKKKQSFLKKLKAGGKTNTRDSADSEKEINKFEIQKLTARVEALTGFVKGFSERFDMISQQIGENRTMSMNNEKSISKVSLDAAKAIDVVKEVKPQNLRFDFQKLELKTEELAQKLESSQQFTETIMNEIKDLRRKSGIFVGTDALLKLNDDVKKDLISIQQLTARTRMHADKSEQMFIAFSKGLAENEKIAGTVNNLDANYSSLKKDLEKVRVDFSRLVNKDDLNDLKRNYDSKMALIDALAVRMDNVKSENDRIVGVIETTLSISQQNKRDIEDIAMHIGDDHIQRVADYENQINSILRILDTLAGQVSEIKDHLKMKGKIKTKPNKEHASTGNEKIVMENIEVDSETSKNLAPKEPNVPENISNIGKREEDDVLKEKVEEHIDEIKKNKQIKKKADARIEEMKKKAKKNNETKKKVDVPVNNKEKKKSEK